MNMSRRVFLRKCGAAGSLALLGPVMAAEVPATGRKHHLSISPDALQADPGLLEVVERAGVTNVWLSDRPSRPLVERHRKARGTGSSLPRLAPYCERGRAGRGAGRRYRRTMMNAQRILVLLSMPRPLGTIVPGADATVRGSIPSFGIRRDLTGSLRGWLADHPTGERLFARLPVNARML